ncbi:MAG: glucosamine-6-phosphate deaminase [Bacteroidetes bacterium]|nr:MAG: glucosamine-6-phosphate deaminase [Bacteroidota bacterium]PTM14342.1 MAG: glucosamine-6-phosphate deaminase [Bacteroidota bacterium]
MQPTTSTNAPNPQLKYTFKTLERIPVKIWQSPEAASRHVAQSIALAIRQKQQEGEHIVLGLATGSSPIRVYQELIRLHREENLSFRNVITFNLDEYYPLEPTAAQSYVRFMHEYLFDHIDIRPENIHIPDGTIPLEAVGNYCEAYEKKINLAGGIDIQLLGIGRTGHIGFNEPGSWESSLTRIVRLDNITRKDAANDFGGIENVPYRAITMGIKTILNARAVYLLAWGQHKAQVVRDAVEGEITTTLPSSFLQKHPNVRFFIDEAAAEELTKIKTPWLVGMCQWDNKLAAKAVIWLSQKVGKPILKLTNEDYTENSLSELILEYDSAYSLNIEIFNRLQHTITGWPGGKPNVDDTNRPERSLPAKKRVVIFSPHPDDDVISMGGTFLRLVEQGHEVHVAYQTSGNIAVHDHDALRFIEFMEEFGNLHHLHTETSAALFAKARADLGSTPLGNSATHESLTIKGLIRRGEARAGARFCGLSDAQIHFLDLPFYETGSVRKKPFGSVDIQLTKDFLNTIRPHQVFAAGDLADPNGTHRVCLDIITTAFHQLAAEKWMKNCWLWLYRGAWQEWPIHEIEMAIPLSPDQVAKKRRGIYMHQSQKDSPPFPGNDEREFWERAEDRNRETAHLYRQLGLAEYEAMEAFQRWQMPPTA